ncbi:hypothetical protein EDC18_102456 [Natranaerovirga pectinivora]|uniref:Uncharacterized protein n=1 Tax=Natranaerovirga pectinivora TaxID=682400 RepID=A0A4V2V0L0_9FIRM|nr:hypothetical protein [Natranaerovirga pectinivora]TCT16437.1 hypothetical protein EDC18_102456 [Natranaerovirga pectinivora]
MTYRRLINMVASLKGKFFWFAVLGAFFWFNFSNLVYATEDIPIPYMLDFGVRPAADGQEVVSSLQMLFRLFVNSWGGLVSIPLHSWL